jgi:hypothetical protein
MHLIQVLLPVRDNDGKAFGDNEFARVRAELAERYGGVTFYSRAPAKGVWKDDDGDVAHDDVLVAEVMAEHEDREWWRIYRVDLEERFRQDTIVARIIACELL